MKFIYLCNASILGGLRGLQSSFKVLRLERIVIFLLFLLTIILIGCIQKKIDYNLDSLFVDFNQKEQDGIKASTYLSKEKGNISGVENAAFKSYFYNDLVNIKSEIDDITSIELVAWNINIERAQIKIEFDDIISENAKIGGVTYDYKE